MAKISTFELLSKRIGPPGGFGGGPNNPFNAAFRKLLQGYFLTIANFNDRRVRLRMKTTFPRINSCEWISPFTINDRELVTTPSNHVYAYDVTGDQTTPANPRVQLFPMVQESFTASSRTFRTRTFRLCPFQTGLINLLPSPASSGQVDPQIEIRGYTEIVQVARIGISTNGTLVYIEQLLPVDLLFTPEHRGTFLDDDFPDFTPPFQQFDFDQSIHALPTATGAGVITITDIDFERVTVPIFDLPDSFRNPNPIPLPSISLEGLAARADINGRIILEDEALQSINDQILKAEEEIGATARPLKAILTEIEEEVNLLFDPSDSEIRPTKQ